MTLLVSIVILLGTLCVLFYRETGLRTGSALFALVWLVLSLWTPVLRHPLAVIPLLAGLAVLNLAPLRRRLISAPVMAQLKKLMPAISDTEREALEAGTTWWDKELFCGNPDWDWFATRDVPRLTEAEQAFLDHEVGELCAMLDEWQIHHELKDLPEPAWRYLKEKGFLGLIIPTEYGGKGFSPFAQSCVMVKLATRSLTAAVTAMVPNSLGPGELLLHYGTDEQKQRWLPGLARGEEMPCFALTGLEAGSDAGAIPDTGVVVYGEYNGERVLGLRLNFAKRWITLAPVATVVGLAFKLYDPDHLLGDTEKTEYGITCALIPADHPGVETGPRHMPGAPFMNGPVNGRDVFIPIDWIIGGPSQAGRGWRMLMECLGAGRGISLPAMATASGLISYRAVGAYARIREQFNTPVGDFEGVQEATAAIAGQTYMLEAMRHWVTLGLGESGAPSVVSAMAKYHATEMMRRVLDHGMDVMGGRGVQLGPRNPLALAYQSVPVAITVEGANILTRSLMIFGQGALRCHPYLFDEMEALASDGQEALIRFDCLLFSHLGYTANRKMRLLAYALSGGRIAPAPAGASAFARPWYRSISRLSTALAFTSDIGLVTLGGEFKVREMLSARLGDVLSQLFIACSVLKYHESLPLRPVNDRHAEYALQQALYAAQEALLGFYDNFPIRWLGKAMKSLVFPFGRILGAVSDQQVAALGQAIMEPSEVREALGRYLYHSDDPDNALGKLESTYRQLLQVEEARRGLQQAIRRGEVDGHEWDQQLQQAIARGVIEPAMGEALKAYEQTRYDCLLTDTFDRQLEKLVGAA